MTNEETTHAGECTDKFKIYAHYQLSTNDIEKKAGLWNPEKIKLCRIISPAKTTKSLQSAADT